MTDRQLAVVTGANRGLGLETTRQLAERSYRVALTSRNLEHGKTAASELARAGCEVVALQLDVTEPKSIAELAAAPELGMGSIAALVNNAGTSFRGFDAGLARATLDTNFYGAWRVTDALAPRLAAGSRIVMVSSGMGELSGVSKQIAERVSDPDLGREALSDLAEEFVSAVARGDHERMGWPSNAYRVSKVLLNALTRILARELAPQKILVNAVCPGWVRTRMGGSAAARGVEQGAASIVWAATLPPDGPTGGFFRDGRPIAW